MKKQKRVFYAQIAAGAGVLLLAFFLVKFPFTVSGPARLVPQAEWIISQPEPDKLQIKVVSNDFSQKAVVQLFHISRPDLFTLQIKEGLRVGDRLSAGSPAALLISLEDQLRTAELLGLLEEAKAQLAASRSGLKRPLQEEADRALQYARAQLAAYEPILQRAQELYERNLISRQEFELTRAQYELYRIDTAVKEARLQTVKTGEKAEDLAVIEAQIRSAADRLELLRKKSAAETLCAPFNGVLVLPNAAVGELLHLCNTDTMIVEMPIKVQDARFVRAGQTATVTLLGDKRLRHKARVIGISGATRLVNLQPMFIAAAQLEALEQPLPVGMIGRFSILVGKKTAAQMLAEGWRSYRFNK